MMKWIRDHLIITVSVFNSSFLDKISAQPHALIVYTFCDSNSIHARSLCKRVSITAMHV